MSSPERPAARDHDAAHWDARYAEGDQLWRAGPHSAVRALTARMPRGAGRALDLGAGDGRHAVWLAQQGWSVTAVDFSPVGVGRGADHAREHDVVVDWVVADVAQWEPAGIFDLVLVAYFRIEGPDWMRVYRWLASGGHLLVVVHGTPGRSGPGGPTDPRFHNTVDSLRERISRPTGHGLEILSCTQEPRVRDAGEPPDGSDIVLLARRQ